ncbi:hypothetical protein A8924_2245 [Saccharopolyspora erythraea NRRL 2338]|uniref:Uncharacterized protein n=2 Tax=Saccharopolyspora erythraea TaxID=1836 RepID=A4FAT3_SACEN|nr:hypothetical protein [Saccharopolyspora erythraea]EQD81975.1 hypothetical protein N599_33225 [Saccharopolyspora erythraea D]PFG94940.1 hypothetical protein A8924_2245 [Saccharopolyspora erythraea NRRL 2338]QRK91635.1 hypothetical protein JQX30_09780 [Saccharopolyspora erythraea]CAM01158.1 hypothetical protein SACE_1846 [Saccharopolyspora erythraea NRRL 2338]
MPAQDGEGRDGPARRFDDDLAGLDPHDPEARAFAEHLDRMERSGSKATVEGMLRGVDDFAQSANRAQGHRRMVAVSLVSLMLFGVLFTVYNAVAFVLETFLR